MREIKLKVLPTKRLICLNDEFVIGRVGESRSTKISVLVPDEYVGEYNYLLFTQNEEKYIVELEHLSWVVNAWILNETGTWSVEFISSDEIVDNANDIKEEDVILLTDSILGYVLDSDLGVTTPPEIEPERHLITQIEQKLDVIIDEIDHIGDQGISVDFTEVLNKIDSAEQTLNDAIDNIDVDLTPILDDLSDLEAKVALIPTNDYSSDFTGIETRLTSIQNSIDNIDIDLTPITTKLNEISTQITNIPNYTTKLNGIEDKIDGIDTKIDGITIPDYSTQLDSIEDKVDLIPTNDYTNKLNSMEDKIDGIPTNDYTSTLSSISTKIDNIPNYTSDLAAIQTAIEGIPTTDYSSELSTIEGKIDNLPDYTTTIQDTNAKVSSIKTTVEAIPTNDYTTKSLTAI